MSLLESVSKVFGVRGGCGRKSNGELLDCQSHHMKKLLRIADAVEKLYYATYLSKCELEGSQPLGFPGRLGYSSPAAILDHMRSREETIKKLLEQIATLRETPSIYLDEAEAIANRLGINQNNNDVEKSVHQ